MQKMFKILNYLNYVFVAFPLIILIAEFGNEDMYSSVAIATICTVIFQLFAGIIWFAKEPLNKRLINYFTFIVLFAIIAAMRLRMSMYLLPMIAIYFSYILHFKAIKTKTIA